MNITHPFVYAIFISLFLAASSRAAQTTCQQIAQRAEQQQALFNPPASYAVMGKGRLYFHTAPDDSCRSREVFVIAGDELIAYTEYQGWFSVMYSNPRSGQDFHGWVRSERLSMRGTMRPAY